MGIGVRGVARCIGQTVKISDEPSIVVGVMPAEFHYPVDQPALFWATYAANAEGYSYRSATIGSTRMARRAGM
jgi:hypothetical protein